MKWRKAETEFVDVARVARLASTSTDGTPHNVPVCPVLDQGRIYFGTEAEAKKVKNIRANPQVALVFDDYVEAWDQLRGILVQGTARVVEQRKFRAIRKKIYAKYLQYESAAPLEEGESVIVEVTPRRKFSWGF